MKKIIISLCLIGFGILIFMCFYALSGNIIKDIKPNECAIEIETIIKISESTSNDIIFSDADGDHYYINRGLERGLNLETLSTSVLNKTVTLHLPKLWLGTSEHIAQLKVSDNVIFTEFN